MKKFDDPVDDEMWMKWIGFSSFFHHVLHPLMNPWTRPDTPNPWNSPWLVSKDHRTSPNRTEPFHPTIGVLPTPSSPRPLVPVRGPAEVTSLVVRFVGTFVSLYWMDLSTFKADSQPRPGVGRP